MELPPGYRLRPPVIEDGPAITDMLNEETLNTAVLQKVFSVLNENKIALVSVRSVGQQTEQAYLDLVEKEESRGFTRLYQPAEAA